MGRVLTRDIKASHFERPPFAFASLPSDFERSGTPDPAAPDPQLVGSRHSAMATFELYRRSTIGMCLTETLDEMVSSGTLSPELAIQVLVQFDKSMTEALENQVKSKVAIKGHLHTYRFCDNVWTFILTEASFKNEETTEQVGKVKIVAWQRKVPSRLQLELQSKGHSHRNATPTLQLQCTTTRQTKLSTCTSLTSLPLSDC
ncbi:hypothetical protein GUJ93_ZPchr0010g11025 [Zizania palustris]|uniref:Transcription initiation factor IIA subunit 2 n=2 Tax=Oryzeae TaxID=147380 RepID=A0A8J6BH91_ZIZPA|nr:hypothetical protein GUJ93_ZPchr0010g11025 [Zizania palustris]